MGLSLRVCGCEFVSVVCVVGLYFQGSFPFIFFLI
jgi:hypothetical protein